MEDLQTGDIKHTPQWITKHLNLLKTQFQEFKQVIDAEYKELLSENQFLFDAYNFKNDGECSVPLSTLSEVDLRIKKDLEALFPVTNFFKIENDRIFNRQQVYYSVIKDEPRIYQIVRTFIFLDSSLSLLQRIQKTDWVIGSFVIASILDDIRYKLILLYEDVLSHEISIDAQRLESLVDSAISNYYTYLLGRPQTTVSYAEIRSFANLARSTIIDYLNNCDPTKGPIKRYKEGDIPNDNLLFIHKLKKSLPSENIQIVAGIRFGGIELPYLVRLFIYKNADVRLEKISFYSDSISHSINPNKYKGKNVLIVDDGITTGRTVEEFITRIKDYANNVYYACIYYSGFKRIKHMQQEGHGGVNLEQLKKCCVLKETNYTASANKTSYTNKQGKFDKIKARVEAKAELGQMRFEYDIPLEEPGSKGENTKKVFIACSASYITESYDQLITIRNKYQKHPEYEIIDDWIVNRIIKVGSRHIYREDPPGRNFLYEAIRDIETSNLLVLFYPGPSAYLSALFWVATMKNKDILIFYRKKEDVEDFSSYPKTRLEQIKKIKSFSI